MNSLVVRILARALQDLVRGRRVRRAGLVNDRALALVLAPHGERRAGEPAQDAERDAPAMLVFALEPGAPHLRIEDPRPLDRRRTAQLGEAPARLAGATIQRVDAIGLERILAVTLAPSTDSSTSSSTDPSTGSSPDSSIGPLVLYFELLARTPFLVVTENGNVLAAVRAPGTRRPDARDMARGSAYQLPFDLGSPAALPTAGALLDGCLAEAGAATPDAWAAALARRLHHVPPALLAALTAGARSAAEVRDRVLDIRGPIHLDAGPPPSLGLATEGTAAIASDHDVARASLAALDEYGALATAALAAAFVRQTFMKALNTAESRARKALAGLEREEARLEDPEVWRRRGEALLAHPDPLPKGARAIQVADPRGGRDPIAIELDPRRPKATNVEALFQTARRMARAAEELATRRVALTARAAEIAAAQAEMAALPDADLAEAGARLARRGVIAADWAKSGEPRAGVGRKAKGEAETKRLPYRRYLLQGGWEIWVGRSAADNDILTHELARPADWWLHAHGASGSHVILRRSDGASQSPPPTALRAAAACAAHFSAARHSKMVPVIVTEKRYVRKPRRSPPGTAVCLREKTVMAAPAEPPAWAGEAVRPDAAASPREEPDAPR